mmetsp:Transcript_99049/g.288924  ORF Transcript_99049/g.288924 Transcript_99049/m.288924 type:complete len:259 (-) Transcript_99049:239-1015(-)
MEVRHPMLAEAVNCILCIDPLVTRTEENPCYGTLRVLGPAWAGGVHRLHEGADGCDVVGRQETPQHHRLRRSGHLAAHGYRQRRGGLPLMQADSAGRHDEDAVLGVHRVSVHLPALAVRLREDAIVVVHRRVERLHAGEEADSSSALGCPPGPVEPVCERDQTMASDEDHDHRGRRQRLLLPRQLAGEEEVFRQLGDVGQLPTEQRLSLWPQSCRALSAAHQAGLVHLDAHRAAAVPCSSLMQNSAISAAQVVEDIVL